mmetsp:Transcript_32981/g.84528  ORF Transcript_32981/g.84528 Transcript_32981/m.84528 type:complete len:200 (-) Transcript_32981:1898-2497(-)
MPQRRRHLGNPAPQCSHNRSPEECLIRIFVALLTRLHSSRLLPAVRIKSVAKQKIGDDAFLLLRKVAKKLLENFPAHSEDLSLAIEPRTDGVRLLQSEEENLRREHRRYPRHIRPNNTLHSILLHDVSITSVNEDKLPRRIILLGNLLAEHQVVDLKFEHEGADKLGVASAQKLPPRRAHVHHLPVLDVGNLDGEGSRK